MRTLRFLSATIAGLLALVLAGSLAYAEAPANGAAADNRGGVFADSFGLYGLGILPAPKAAPATGSLRQKPLPGTKAPNPAAPPDRAISSGNERLVKTI